MTRAITVLTLAIFTFSAAPASATSVCDGDVYDELYCYGIIGVLTTAFGALTFGAVGGRSANRSQRLRELLKRDGYALAREVSTGSGAVLADLAEILAVPPEERGALGKFLRSRRHEVLMLIAREDSAGLLALVAGRK